MRARAACASSSGDRSNFEATIPCYSCSKRDHSVLLTAGFVFLDRLNITPGVATTKEDVAQALKLLEVHVCTHMRSSDQPVLDHYSPDCKAHTESAKKLEYRPLFCKTCSAFQKLRASCNAHLAFNVPPPESRM